MDQMTYDRRATFEELLSVVRQLRDPISGCPWDREQTHVSLVGDLIEESYEVIDALESNVMQDLVEELGDLLLQITHHIAIAEENHEFSVEDVFAGIVNKLVRRHPHVFSSNQAASSSEVLQQWEKIKQEERKQSSSTDTPFSGLPRAMPALLHAQKTQIRASSLGLDWAKIDGPLEKIQEEFKELNEANSKEDQLAETGDLLFSVVNAARWMGIDAETALRYATDKFQGRTETFLETAREQHVDLLVTSVEEKERLWNVTKALKAKEE